MQKLWQKHQKFMKGDAGFSLVELIIVIAIMAALIAILAPQYIKYVEKSRQSADISAVDSILSACKTVAIDPEYYDDVSAGFEVEWDGTDITSTTANVQTAVRELVGATVESKSKDFATVTFTFDESTGAVTLASTAAYIDTAFNS
jgi:type IV pilus assembly protein PilA